MTTGLPRSLRTYLFGLVAIAAVSAAGLVLMLGSAKAASPDRDGDGVLDDTDICPGWYDPQQAYPPWSIPQGDSDCDGFADTTTGLSRASEMMLGTDPEKHCADTPAANDEDGPDAWPMDFNDDQKVSVQDILAYRDSFGARTGDSGYDARDDLNGDGLISSSDVLRFGMFFGKDCTAPIVTTPTPSPTLAPTPTPPCPAAPGPTTGTSLGTPVANGYTMNRLPADAGVDELTNVAVVPGDPGRAIITTEAGNIWFVCLFSNKPREQVGDFTSFVRDQNAGHSSDEGLVGFAYDPFDPSLVYIDYSIPQVGGSYLGATPNTTTIRSRISRFHIDNGQIDVSSEKVIIDIYQPWEWHNADGLVFGPDGYLYIGSGDGGGDHNVAQSTSNFWGKILRIDVHNGDPYSIPADNPFGNETWAYGLRNPWRFTFDGDQMWLSDVGESKYEEVNKGVAGANYGWPQMEGPSCFQPGGSGTPTPTPVPCNPAGMATPRAYYTHDFSTGGCAIIGGSVYRGSLMPELDGYYIYADFCTGRIWGVDTASDTSAPIMLADTALNIDSWGVTESGELIAIHHSSGNQFGGVYELGRVQ
ncbi:MAG: PQQ-dependent sugar dehydrogenase [Chloroflexota bacterium]